MLRHRKTRDEYGSKIPLGEGAEDALAEAGFVGGHTARACFIDGGGVATRDGGAGAESFRGT